MKLSSKKSFFFKKSSKYYVSFSLSRQPGFSSRNGSLTGISAIGGVISFLGLCSVNRSFFLDMNDLSILSVRGHRLTFSQVLTPSHGLTTNKKLSMFIRSFEHTCFPREVCPLVLCSFMRPPYDPLWGTSDRDLTPKTVLILPLDFAKKVSELRSLTVPFTRRNREYGHFLFVSEFMARTQNRLMVSQFHLSVTVGNDEEEMLKWQCWF